MPRHFLPRKSGPHRIACIALYRALLTQCPRIALPADLPSQGAVNPIKHLIRKGFRRYVNCTSPKILVEVLKGGYEAEELLRTAGDGDKSSLSSIHNQLWELHRQRETARATCLLPPPRSQKPPPRVWPYPSAPKLLDVRPLPKEQLSGKRGLPKLAAANGVPFLRVKKPQSEYLGRVLRDKAAQKQRRFERLKEMEEGGDAGGAEEEWGRLVAEAVREEMDEAGREKEKEMRRWLEREGKIYEREDWTGDVEGVRRKAYKVMMEEQRRWLDMGKRMAGIAEDERDLWQKEREEYKEWKYKERVKRNQVKKEALKRDDPTEGKGLDKTRLEAVMPEGSKST